MENVAAILEDATFRVALWHNVVFAIGTVIGKNAIAIVLAVLLNGEMRGRTFATLYTVVRVCLLLSLTLGPFVASGLGALSDRFFNGELSIGSATLSLPGVRLALWAGGGLTVLSGIAARRRMRKTQREEAAAP